jgi:hypothetical protein
MFSCSQKLFVIPQDYPPLMGWIGEIISEEDENCVIAILRDESVVSSRTGCVVRLSLNSIKRFDTPKEAIRQLKLNTATTKRKD